ncbi:MAG: hypothetical protein L0H64_19330, partial [Pseudonocardia sp.]|nr:hypothetical protein [Pseudonocardia sp.]
MARRIPRVSLDGATYRGWPFVLVLGVLLAVIALFDRGSIDLTQSDGATGCSLEVTTDELNVRAGPAEAAELLGSI